MKQRLILVGGIILVTVLAVSLFLFNRSPNAPQTETSRSAPEQIEAQDEPDDRRVAPPAFASPATTQGEIIGGLDETKTTPPAIPDEPTEETTFRSGTGNTIRGTVLLWKDRSPVEGATVFLLEGTNNHHALRKTQTDAEGRFEILDGRKTIVYLTAAKPLLNLTSRTSGFLDAERLNLRHAEDTEHELVFLLRPGRVADVHVLSAETGEPIAGASVTFSGRPALFTDASGYALMNSLYKGEIQLEANAPGYAIQKRTANLNSAKRTHVEFRLGPGGSIGGRAVDEQGLPVAGLRVRATTTGGYPSVSINDSTQADGSFRFESLPLDETIQVSPAREEVFSSSLYRGNVEAKLSRTQRHAEVELKLSPKEFTGAIEGRVTEAGGAPIEDARVVWGMLTGGRSPETLTDSQGNYRLDHIESSSSSRQLYVSAPGYAPERTDIVPGTSDHPSRVDFSLDAGHWIEGRIVDPDASPIEGVWLQGLFWGYSMARDTQQFTGQDGKFRIDSAPAKLGLHITMEGYADQMLDDVGELDRDIGDVVLTPQSEITGQVVDADTGEPIKRFSVRASGANRYGRSQGQEISSDEGQFQLGGLRAGRDVALTIRAHGYETTVFESIAVPTEQEKPPVYELRAGVQSLYGMVLDEEGRAVPGAEVTLVVYKEKDRQRSGFSWGYLRGVETNALMYESQRTDSMGIFGFDGLPAWPESAGKPDPTYAYPVDLLVIKSGYAKRRVTKVEDLDIDDWKNLVVDVAAGATLTVDVDLDVIPRARQIHLFKKGIGSRRGTPTETKRLSGGSSQVTFDDMQAGKYLIRLYAGMRAGRNTAQVALVEVTLEGGESATTRIPEGPSATLRGRVTVGGQVIESGRLGLSRHVYGLPFEPAAPLNSNGEYSFEYIQPGSYTASVRELREGNSVSQLPRISPYDLNIEIPPGDNVRDFEFEPGAQVVGRLTNYTADPQLRLTIQFRENPQGRRLFNTEIHPSDDGRFVIENVAEGAHIIYLRSGNGIGRTPLTEFEVARGQSRVDLGSLPLPTGSVRGRIIGLSQTEDVRLILRSYTSGQERSWYYGSSNLDAEGGFKFGRARGGRYVLNIRDGNDSRIINDEVRVPEDGEIDLGDIDLGGGGSILVRVTGDLSVGGDSELPLQIQVRPWGSQVGDPGFEFPLADVRFEPGQTEALLEHVPTGEVSVRILEVLYSGEPTETRAIVADGQTTEVAIKVESLTVLFASVQNAANVSSVVITNEGTGERIEFEKLANDQEAMQAMASGQRRLAIFTNNRLMASGFAPGRWNLEVIDAEGRMATAQVDLIKGQMVQTVIEFPAVP